MSQVLESLREKIHEIDQQLVQLLQKRIQTALQIGQIKSDLGLPIFDPQREQEVITHVLDVPHAPMDSESLKTLFIHILEICRKAEMNAYSTPQKIKGNGHDCCDAR